MYKKIILCLLFPFFSSSENLCAEPSVTEIAVAAAAIATGIVVTQVGLHIYKRCHPTPDEIIRNAEAQKQTAIYQKQLDYMEAEADFKKCALKCAENSKSGVDIALETMPTACKEIALKLIACGGEDKVTWVITTLNKYKS